MGFQSIERFCERSVIERDVPGVKICLKACFYAKNLGFVK